MALDAKRPAELYQLLHEALGLLDAAQRAAAAAPESRDAAQARLIGFLHVLKYPLPDDV